MPRSWAVELSQAVDHYPGAPSPRRRRVVTDIGAQVTGVRTEYGVQRGLLAIGPTPLRAHQERAIGAW